MRKAKWNSFVWWIGNNIQTIVIEIHFFSTLSLVSLVKLVKNSKLGRKTVYFNVHKRNQTEADSYTIWKLCCENKENHTIQKPFQQTKLWSFPLFFQIKCKRHGAFFTTHSKTFAHSGFGPKWKHVEIITVKRMSSWCKFGEWMRECVRVYVFVHASLSIYGCRLVKRA